MVAITELMLAGSEPEYAEKAPVVIEAACLLTIEGVGWGMRFSTSTWAAETHAVTETARPRKAA
jgi:hypothetical protein